MKYRKPRLCLAGQERECLGPTYSNRALLMLCTACLPLPCSWLLQTAACCALWCRRMKLFWPLALEKHFQEVSWEMLHAHPTIPVRSCPRHRAIVSDSLPALQ